MTEHEFLTSKSPEAMMNWLLNGRDPITGAPPFQRPSTRQLALTAAACIECCGCILYRAKEIRLAPYVNQGMLDHAVMCGSADPEIALAKANLVRDICGNPYKPLLLPKEMLARTVLRAPGKAITKPVGPLHCPWLVWNRGIVKTAAQSIYDKNTWDELPILADLLEEAGCTDEAILGHLRNGLAHVPGCHVVDLLREQS